MKTGASFGQEGQVQMSVHMWFTASQTYLWHGEVHTLRMQAFVMLLIWSTAGVF